MEVGRGRGGRGREVGVGKEGERGGGRDSGKVQKFQCVGYDFQYPIKKCSLIMFVGGTDSDIHLHLFVCI